MRLTTMRAMAVLFLGLAACGAPEDADQDFEEEGIRPEIETKVLGLRRPDRLYPGELLASDEAIRNGPNNRFELVMERSCNLVVRDAYFKRLLWQSNTAGRSLGCVATMDLGQLTILGSSTVNGTRQRVWAANPSGGALYAQIDVFGDFALFNERDQIVWGGGTRVLQEKFLDHSQRDRLLPGEGLFASYDESLFGGSTRLTMQHDCNLVLYDHSFNPNGIALWSSKTAGQGAHCYVQMQTDGNLVIYNKAPLLAQRKIWASNTQGRAYSLHVQSDGNLVLRHANGRDVWATGTRLRAPDHEPIDSHPGCRQIPQETKCGAGGGFPPGVLICRDTFVCPVPGQPTRTRMEYEPWKPCGICVKLPF
jgi:hypothetical protein